MYGNQFEKSTNTSVIRRFTAFNNSAEYRTIIRNKKGAIMKSLIAVAALAAPNPSRPLRVRQPE